MLTNFRSQYEKISIPFGKASLKLGLTPDAWTFFGLLSCCVAAVCFAQQRYWLGFFLVVVMNIADMLDGATARAGNCGSVFGTIFDHVTDRYEEFLLIGGLMWGGAISGQNALFTASGIIMASYVRAKAESVAPLKMGAVGIAGRQEKLFLMMLALVLFGFGWMDWGNVAIWAVGVISHITAVQRLFFARTAILGPKKSG
jgi:CDP-diacylglycerol--glycerol-3-phosphate 3-phosphatidyltransferase